MNSEVAYLYRELTGSDWEESFDPILAGKFAEALIKQVTEELNSLGLLYESALIYEKFMGRR